MRRTLKRPPIIRGYTGTALLEREFIKNLPWWRRLYGKIRGWKPELRVLPVDAELPRVADLIGLVPDLTGSLSAEEYVRKLRNG